MTNNTILITGGGSGIGRALAEALHKLGNKVIIAGRGPERLRQTVAANPGMEAMTLDVTDPGDVRRFAAEVTERFPSLNVLVNNAGIMRGEDLAQGIVTDAEEIIATNLLGPIRLTAALMPNFLRQLNAAVMNVSSGLGFVPMAATPTYCATKAAIHSYSLSLRKQLEGTSVEVVEIVPPYVQTHLNGEHQATDPRAMPLDDYIADTMAILAERPTPNEVIIERVEALRYAERNGSFNDVFQFLGNLGREIFATSVS